MDIIALIAAALPLGAFMIVASITPDPTICSWRRPAPTRVPRHAPTSAWNRHWAQFSGRLVRPGIGSILLARPELQALLKGIAAAYLAWLAFRLATASPPGEGKSRGDGKPMSFIGAAAFQWINPKAWMMALTASGALLPTLPDRVAAIALACVTIVAVNFPCVSVWAVFGSGMRQFLTRPLRWRVFNGVMGASLLLTAWWIVRS